MNVANPADRNSVAIGGVGGSGTRLVAAIVSHCGFYLGSSLNKSHDNLWFTYLLKRPAWFGKFPSQDEIVKALRLFERASIVGLSSSANADDLAMIDAIFRTTEGSPDFSRDDLGVLADQLRTSRGIDLANYAGWGWKEPNTHIFLPQIAATFAGVRYVHVMRNGLDMAFSKNRQQVQNWGSFFGIVPEDRTADDPAAALDYWIKANRRVMDIGGALLKDRFHVVRYEDLCARPAVEVSRLAAFLGVTLSPEAAAAMTQSVKPPPTIARYRNFDIVHFSQSQIEAVRQFGFSIDPA